MCDYFRVIHMNKVNLYINSKKSQQSTMWKEIMPVLIEHQRKHTHIQIQENKIIFLKLRLTTIYIYVCFYVLVVVAVVVSCLEEKK